MSARHLAGLALVALLALVVLVLSLPDSGPGPAQPGEPLAPGPEVSEEPVDADASEVERVPVRASEGEAEARADEPPRPEVGEQPGGARVVGQVVDRTGRPLAGHFLVLMDAAGRAVQEAPVGITDPGGRFEYPELAPGRFTLWVALAPGVEPAITAAQEEEGGPWVHEVHRGARLVELEVEGGVELDLGRLVVEAPLPYHLRGRVELQVTEPDALEQLMKNLRVRLSLAGDTGTVHHARVRIVSEEAYGWLGEFDFVLDRKPPGELDLRVSWGARLLLEHAHWPGADTPDTLELGSLALDGHVRRAK